MRRSANSKKKFEKKKSHAGSLSEANTKHLEGNHEHFISRYKTNPCKKPRCQDKAFCSGFHHYGERRRNPRVFVDYTEEPCPAVKEACGKWREPARCKLGDSCKRSHTVIEVMYHPNIYKTQKCSNYFNPKGNRCTWGAFCTHAHQSIRTKTKKKGHVPDNKNSVSVMRGVGVNLNSVKEESDVDCKIAKVAGQKHGVVLDLSPTSSMSIMGTPVMEDGKVPTLSYSSVATLTYSSVSTIGDKAKEEPQSPYEIFTREPFMGVPWPHLYNNQMSGCDTPVEVMPQLFFPIKNNSNSLFSFDNGIWAYGSSESEGGSAIVSEDEDKNREQTPNNDCDNVYLNLLSGTMSNKYPAMPDEGTPSVVSMEMSSPSPERRRSPTMRNRMFSAAQPFSMDLQKSQRQVRIRDLTYECTRMKHKMEEMQEALTLRETELLRLSEFTKALE